jgi:hypothetical protein
MKHVRKDGHVRRPGSKEEPAFVLMDGMTLWWRDAPRERGGGQHRDHGPAVLWPDGSHRWMVRNKIHREGGPAVRILSWGTAWYTRGWEERVEKEEAP